MGERESSERAVSPWRNICLWIGFIVLLVLAVWFMGSAVSFAVGVLIGAGLTWLVRAYIHDC